MPQLYRPDYNKLKQIGYQKSTICKYYLKYTIRRRIHSDMTKVFILYGL